MLCCTHPLPLAEVLVAVVVVVVVVVVMQLLLSLRPPLQLLLVQLLLSLLLLKILPSLLLRKPTAVVAAAATAAAVAVAFDSPTIHPNTLLYPFPIWTSAPPHTNACTTGFRQQPLPMLFRDSDFLRDCHPYCHET